MKIGIIIAVVLVALGGGALVLTQNKDDSSSELASTSQESSHGTAEEHGHSDADHEHMEESIVEDACQVFTATEISGSLGVTFADGSSDGYTVMENSDGLPQVQCDWEQDGGDDINEYTVTVSAYNFATEEKAKTDINNSRINAGSLTYEDIPGVADEALFARSGAEGAKKVQAQIYWRDGFQVYHMSAVKLEGVDVPALEAQLKTLVANKF